MESHKTLQLRVDSLKGLFFYDVFYYGGKGERV